MWPDLSLSFNLRVRAVLRRSLGISLQREEKLLGQFITRLEDQRAATVTTADALAWVTLPAGTSARWLTSTAQWRWSHPRAKPVSCP
jgi:hypothetical protein